jgi:nucleolar protein 12
MIFFLLLSKNLVKKVCANTNMLNKDAKSTAQGYVVFCSKDSVEEALKLNNMLVEGLRLRVDHATPTPDALRSIFVGNLPYQAEEMSLQQHFVKECGFQEIDVEGVRIIRDKDTMLCKGFGYVIFREKSMVAVALNKMHESTYMKRQLRVTVCGKCFKGRRGDDKAEDSTKRRSFEGKRSVVVAPGAIKRILGKKASAKEDSIAKKRRARGDPKKKAAKKAGVSKRAAAVAKIGKRMKKIKKRVSKGMGKARGK